MKWNPIKLWREGFVEFYIQVGLACGPVWLSIFREVTGLTREEAGK